MRSLPRVLRAIAYVSCCALVTAAVAIGSSTATSDAAAPGAAAADHALDAALIRLVKATGGPPAVAVVVQRGTTPVLHTAGEADTATHTTVRIDDHLRLASVAKAFSGAAALALVGEGKLDTGATVGEIRPDLPDTWADVTLAQLLQHTSGIPDFSGSKEFQAAVKASPTVAPPPAQLLSYVADDPLEFSPGSRYQYSNSDNIVVGLMVEKVTGTDYATALGPLVYTPLGLTATSLPRDDALPTPFVHGYAVDPPSAPEDVSEPFAAGWAWASGGVVSTPADANRFVRGYVHGDETTPAVLLGQFKFRAGSSEPPGPGTNSAGLAVFRYQTKCGTVYGHTGNTAGFTQFIAVVARREALHHGVGERADHAEERPEAVQGPAPRLRARGVRGDG